MRKIENSELNRPTIDQYKQMDKLPVVLVLNSLRSLNNVGSLFRSSDAFGVEELYLCGITATPPNREIHKTALGAELSVKWRYVEDCATAIELLKEQGYTIIAIEQVQGAYMLDKFNFKPENRYAIVLGNEVMGVEQRIVDMCDKYIEIPQIGTKHSLNVSVAGGVVLWKAFCDLYK